MIRAAVISGLCAAATPVWADAVRCELSPECEGTTACDTITTVAFSIDRDQFAPAQDASDPPRRKITTVTMGEARFPAEPIWFETGVRGFSAEALGGGTQLLIVQPDGNARYTEEPVGRTLEGSCQIS